MPFFGVSIICHLVIVMYTYFWWTLYDNSPLSECQCFGSLNHLGKSHRSDCPKRFNVMMRDPNSEFSKPLQVASPDCANRYSTSFEPAVNILQICEKTGNKSLNIEYLRRAHTHSIIICKIMWSKGWTIEKFLLTFYNKIFHLLINFQPHHYHHHELVVITSDE